jgi:hypothetical protein
MLPSSSESNPVASRNRSRYTHGMPLCLGHKMGLTTTRIANLKSKVLLRSRLLEREKHIIAQQGNCLAFLAVTFLIIYVDDYLEAKSNSLLTSEA